MMPTVSPSNGLGGAGAGGNVVEFHFNRSTPDQVRVQLKKGGVKVGEQMMKEGDIFQTPWMGMRLFLGSIVVNAKANSGAHPVSAKANGKSQVQSAILVRPVGASESFWLAQGDVRSFEIAGRKAAVVFSNQVLTLPVQIHLETFTKKDYPGTETPYSYESLVTVENATPEIPADKKILISMNEPLNAKGFTFYQSSFSLTPGQKPVSILSVNRDPGRPVKYLGSLILSLGIIIFTLMRSRMANQMSSSMTKTGTRRNSK